MPYGTYAGRLRGLQMATEQGNLMRQEEENKRRYEAEQARIKRMDEENQKRYEEENKERDKAEELKLEMMKNQEEREKTKFKYEQEEADFKKEIREKIQKPELLREASEQENRIKRDEEQYNQIFKPIDNEGLTDFVEVLGNTNDPEQAKNAFNAKGKFKMLEVRRNEPDGNTWILEDRNGKQEWRVITPQMEGAIKQHISQGRKYIPYRTPMETIPGGKKTSGTRSIGVQGEQPVETAPAGESTKSYKPISEELKQNQQKDIGIVASAVKALGYAPALFVDEVTIGKDQSGQIITKQTIKPTDQLSTEGLAILSKFNSLRSIEQSKNIPPSAKKTDDQLALEAVNIQIKNDKNYQKISDLQNKISEIDAKIAKVPEGEPIPESLVSAKRQFENMMEVTRTNMLGGAKSKVQVNKKDVSQIPGVTKVK